MRSASFALVLLILRFDAGLSGDPLLSDDDSVRATDDCLRDACIYLIEACRNRAASYGSTFYNCVDLLSDCFDRMYNKKSVAIPAKRGSITKNSYLFMKLHPVLNKAVDPGLVNVPTRYRRIGGRLGSEFLGKRSGGDIQKREADAAVERRSLRAPSTELLGKRNVEMLGKRGADFLGKRGSEFLGKRGSEFLGKRGTEFLGKRGSEFLGKRGSEFLGKRGSEFLGKRGSEFLGKRGSEFLGKRGSEFLGKHVTCRTASGDECYSPDAREEKLLVQYLKVAAGMVGDQAVGSLPIERRLGSRSPQTPVYLLGKL